MLKLVVVNDNPQMQLMSNSLDTTRLCAENIRLLVFMLAAMDAEDITARDWNNMLDLVLTLCGAVETLTNLNGR